MMEGTGLDSRIGARFLNARLGWGGSFSGKDIQTLPTNRTSVLAVYVASLQRPQSPIA